MKKHGEHLAVPHVPESGGLVLASRRSEPAVRTERHRCDGVPMAAELSNNASAGVGGANRRAGSTRGKDLTAIGAGHWFLDTTARVVRAADALNRNLSSKHHRLAQRIF